MNGPTKAELDERYKTFVAELLQNYELFFGRKISLEELQEKIANNK